MIDRYKYEERVAIISEYGKPTKIAEAETARSFFNSCNLPTVEDKADAVRLGWSKMKMFRTMNQEGLTIWR